MHPHFVPFAQLLNIITLAREGNKGTFRVSAETALITHLSRQETEPPNPLVIPILAREKLCCSLAGEFMEPARSEKPVSEDDPLEGGIQRPNSIAGGSALFLLC